MNKSVLGIDLGTSSVKILQRYQDGRVVKVKAGYEEISPVGWWKGICYALSKLNLNDVEAIGLSSQVGTYIVNDTEVIGWNSGAGAEELAWVKQNFTQETFVKEISMPHPSIISYPIVRLKYIKENYQEIKSVCQPKDYICENLTGNRVTDPYSWRGLANLEIKTYSKFFLDAIEFDKEKLPPIMEYTKIAGYTKGLELEHNRLPEGIPVYVGLNDYYASLLGMGIQKVGDMFDITGTSEHLGIIESTISMETQMVSGPYLKENVHYGVTASSGTSLDFGLQFMEHTEMDLDEITKGCPPIFLPYLNGERAPIWDADARGMFFGISQGCTKTELAYAVLEGVVFSLYHIYENMGKPYASMMKIGGGAAVNPVLNQLKAEMFGIPAVIVEEKDTSALGAAMVAAIGCGWYADEKETIAEICKTKEKIEPTGRYKAWLGKRYVIYKELYPAVKEQYQKLKELRT